MMNPAAASAALAGRLPAMNISDYYPQTSRSDLATFMGQSSVPYFGQNDELRSHLVLCLPISAGRRRRRIARSDPNFLISHRWSSQAFCQRAETEGSERGQGVGLADVKTPSSTHTRPKSRQPRYTEFSRSADPRGGSFAAITKLCRSV